MRYILFALLHKMTGVQGAIVVTILGVTACLVMGAVLCSVVHDDTETLAELLRILLNR